MSTHLMLLWTFTAWASQKEPTKWEWSELHRVSWWMEVDCVKQQQSISVQYWKLVNDHALYSGDGRQYNMIPVITSSNDGNYYRPSMLSTHCSQQIFRYTVQRSNGEQYWQMYQHHHQVNTYDLIKSLVNHVVWCTYYSPCPTNTASEVL